MQPFSEWVIGADKSRAGDPLWSVQAYRLGLYAVASLTFDRRNNERFARSAALDQVIRAVGSVSANLAEGYSRGTVADRARFYGYALGSAREAIAWYDTLTLELGDLVTERQGILIQIRRLLLAMLKRIRPDSPGHTMRDYPKQSPNSDN
jgi:four helix bundle protein